MKNNLEKLTLKEGRFVDSQGRISEAEIVKICILKCHDRRAMTEERNYHKFVCSKSPANVNAYISSEPLQENINNPSNIHNPFNTRSFHAILYLKKK